MAKIQAGPKTWIYPKPTFLIGTNIDDKPNFMAVGWCGVANSEPPMISVAIQPHRYTYKGILQNLVFSINVPSVDLVKETDYCGIQSGAREDKVEACRFSVFYGKLGKAPLIEQCPINLECKVLHILVLGSHSLIIGRVEETHVLESCLNDGTPDMAKIKPILYSGLPTSQYYAVGEVIAKAHGIGRVLIKGK